MTMKMLTAVFWVVAQHGLLGNHLQDHMQSQPRRPQLTILFTFSTVTLK